ncbi:MAG: hypothetical protein DRH37_01715 [Deltaproteobacteria bacterium]|nr:MAG: hypothetical protein DRH37_01715 [Deltaproteobacteria bacterium]
MIKINLLPFRAAKKLENIRMQLSIYILSVILVVAVLGLSFISLNREVNDLRAKNVRLRKELASYSEMLNKIAALKKKRKDLQGKLSVIQRLEASKAGPVQLFDEIAMAVPQGRLFLKSLNESKDRVNMSGVAKDYDTVALFMTRIEKTNKIQTVNLGSTSKSVQEGQTVSNFNLICMKKVAGDKTTKKRRGRRRHR